MAAEELLTFLQNIGKEVLKVPKGAAGVIIQAAQGKGAAKIKKLLLLVPTSNESRPFEGLKFQQVSRKDIEAAVHAIGGVTIVPEALFLAQNPADIDLVPLSSVDLVEGGKYVVVFAHTPLQEQVRELRGWRDNIVTGMESAAGEKAIKRLQESGHDDVRRYCGPHKIRRPGSNSVAVEIDAAAIAPHCALVAQQTSLVTFEAAEQLKDALTLITSLADEGIEALQPFKGKKLLGAVAGPCITSNASNKAKLLDFCQKHNIEIWLPNGGALGGGDSCTESPEAPSCRPANSPSSATAALPMARPHATWQPGIGSLARRSMLPSQPPGMRRGPRALPVAVRPYTPASHGTLRCGML